MMNANTSEPFYPAAYKNVLAVGSTNPDDTRTAPFFWAAGSGSNYGSNISVVAPGNYIYNLSDDGYNTCWGGTSQAAPLVTGVASLLIAQNPAISALAIKQIICSTADDQVGKPSEDTPGWDQYYGYGRINAEKALEEGARLLMRSDSSVHTSE
jgi:subtilisin family serine protease